jgi:hypothetical protein
MRRRESVVFQGNPPVEQNGNAILIGQVYDPFLRQQVSISYELTVPADTRIRSRPRFAYAPRTGSGRILVDLPSTASFALDAETGSGAKSPS